MQNDWNTLLDSVAAAPAQITPLLSRTPHPASIAATERASMEGQSRQQLLERSHARALNALAIPTEALVGITRLLRLLPLELMPGPIVRTGVVAAGVVLWLMDMNIGAEERAKRALGILSKDIGEG